MKLGQRSSMLSKAQINTRAAVTPGLLGMSCYASLRKQWHHQHKFIIQANWYSPPRHYRLCFINTQGALYGAQGSLSDEALKQACPHLNRQEVGKSASRTHTNNGDTQDRAERARRRCGESGTRERDKSERGRSRCERADSLSQWKAARWRHERIVT